LIKPDAPALLADGRGYLGELVLLREHGHEGLHRAHALGEELHHARLVQHVADAEALVELQGGGHKAQPVRVGEDLEDHLPKALSWGVRS
jgi:hypothetical protein